VVSVNLNERGSPFYSVVVRKVDDHVNGFGHGDSPCGFVLGVGSVATAAKVMTAWSTDDDGCAGGVAVPFVAMHLGS